MGKKGRLSKWQRERQRRYGQEQQQQQQQPQQQQHQLPTPQPWLASGSSTAASTQHQMVASGEVVASASRTAETNQHQLPTPQPWLASGSSTAASTQHQMMASVEAAALASRTAVTNQMTTAALTYPVPPAATYRVPPPVTNSVPPAAAYRVPPPVTYSVPPPATYRVPPPPTYPVPPPPTYPVPPPATCTATSAAVSTSPDDDTRPPQQQQEEAPKGSRLGDILHFMARWAFMQEGCPDCKPSDTGGGNEGHGGNYFFVKETLDGFDSKLHYRCETCSAENVLQFSRPRQWGAGRSPLAINEVLVLRAEATGGRYDALQQLADRLGHPCLSRPDYIKLAIGLRRACAPDNLPAATPGLTLEEGFDILKF